MLSIKKVEGAVTGQVLLEGVLPGSVEVDSIGQDKPGEGVDSTLRNQVLYPVFCLFADPVINGDTGLLRCLGKIKNPETGTIVFGESIQEFG